MKKTILVTGCSGFLGSHLVKHFKNNNYKNYKIIGIDLKKTLFKYHNFFFYKF